jgi:hypothetical protein
MSILLPWIKAHVEELLHQLLLWHWAWLTFRHISEFTLLSLEHSTHSVILVIWTFSVWRHFRRRLCNTKTVKAEV